MLFKNVIYELLNFMCNGVFGFKIKEGLEFRDWKLMGFKVLRMR